MRYKIITKFYFSLIFIVFIFKMFINFLYPSFTQYLELRFGSVWVRWLTSFTFILQILLLNAVTLFAPSIALEALLVRL